jgi:hypothetical protein
LGGGSGRSDSSSGNSIALKRCTTVSDERFAR